MRRAPQFLFMIGILLSMSGCGSQSQSQSPPPITLPLGTLEPASLSITDTPPVGVTVLFFQLDITGATLSYQSGEALRF